MDQLVSFLDVFNQFLDLGDSLNQSGVKMAWILGIGFLFFVTLVISLREVLTWYLKTQKVEGELVKIQAQLDLIAAELKRRDEPATITTPTLLKAEPAFIEETPEPKPAEKSFPLHH